MHSDSTRPHATADRSVYALERVLVCALAAATLGAALLLPATPADAASAGQKVDNPAEWKDEWQARYLDLRIEEARLHKTIELATKEYADANRRNYRRSGVRHFHRVNADAAEARLEEIRQEKEALAEEIRDFGGFAWWIDEFEELPLNQEAIGGLGAYANGERFGPPAKPDVPILPDDGTNPRFDDKEEETKIPAAPEPANSEDAAGEDDPAFDYIRWLEDNDAYERKVSPGSEKDESED